MERRATYRLQLHAGFTFADAQAAIPYLAKLGVSHLYLSPVLQAADGSMHGYDVVDPDRVSTQLGGEAGWASLVAATKAAGLGILLDIVPNHMSIAGSTNHWWLDVLENGRASYYAHCFDVDWASEHDRVLLPVLGERYGRALTSGAIRVRRFGVLVHDLELPMAPRSIGQIARRAGDTVGDAELQFIGDALQELPRAPDRDARRRRHRDKAVLLARLAALPAGPIDAELAAIDADPAALDALLENQNYRLAHWSVAGSDLGYRRFFDVSTLVGVRIEDPEVLEMSHKRVFGWLADGSIDGVRVDHVDGLRDPGTYLATLRQRAPNAWIVVEKILGGDEQMPAWLVEGTTGYEFMERVGPLFVDPAGEAQLTEAFTKYTGVAWDPRGESRRARHEVMSQVLHSELARLTTLALAACRDSPACRDFTSTEVEAALAELLAGYTTYRTYGGDRERIATAAARAEGVDPDLLSFLVAALALELGTPQAETLALAVQQTSGPVVAKGDEDTLLYRQVRLLARNDVGAELGTFARTPAEVHEILARGAPFALLATTTHDTKRSEDVRMRIAALSECPTDWGWAAARWGERAARHWGEVERDRTFEWTMWQTLVGAWPLPIERATEFAQKATKEARLRTSWRRPDAAYEAARDAWLAGVYGDVELVAEIETFAERIRPDGDRNSLAQLLIKLVAPGVPDLYQGSELRDDSLVDPDNRRPVDLEARRALLGTRPTEELGSRKLWLIAKALEARRGRAELGPYRPLVVTGPAADRVFAFARGDDLVAVVPRLREAQWRGTSVALPGGRWRDVLSERDVSSGDVHELLRVFPAALLVRG